MIIRVKRNNLGRQSSQSSVRSADVNISAMPQSEAQRERKAKERASRLIEQRQIFENAYQRWTQGSDTYFAIDIETYELDHSYITEVGLSVHKSGHSGSNVSTRHFRVYENRFMFNGRHVANNATNFRHGSTEIIPLHDVVAALNQALRAIDPASMHLVFHDRRGDLEALQELGVRLPPCDIIDTVVLYTALTVEAQGHSLGRVSKALGVQADFLHNAGNDSHATMECMIAMFHKFELNNFT